MKRLLITTIAAVLVVGCGESQQSAPAPEAKPEPSTAKAPDISIHDAAREGNIEPVKQHLAAGTDVDAKNDAGHTPLHLAAFRGHKEIAELLITNGADLNAQDELNGTIPLHNAAGRGYNEIVKLLIAKDVDVNAKDDHGWTPLLLATNKEIAELLIANGADVNAKNNRGMTPLSFTTHPDNPNKNKAEIADLLRKHGGKMREELKAEGK